MAEKPSPRLPWWRRWFGTRSERSALRFLRKAGHRLLARNYSCKFGELDLITLDGGCIVFVEVRSTASNDALRPALSVDNFKQRQLTRLARFYLAQNRLLERSARFDVLSVHWPENAKQPQITHYVNAFEACE